MKYYKYAAVATLLVSTMAMGDTIVNTTTSSEVLTDLKVKSLGIEPSKFFYLVDDFGDLASLPGFSLGAPSGMVSGGGVAFASLGGTAGSGSTDGSLAFGVGFGDPLKTVGGSASLSIGSVNPTDGGAFNRGSLNLSVGRHIPEYKLGVSVGISNIDIWHEDSDDEVDPSYYGAVTKLLPNDTAPMAISAGIGSNAYADISEDDPKNKWDGFISGAVYIHPQMSVILDYTSGITTFGTSIVPMPDYPVTVGLALQDIFKENEEEDSIKFLGTLAVGYAF